MGEIEDAAEPPSDRLGDEAPAASEPLAVRGFGVNAGAALEMRERFAHNPDSVHPSWAALFARAPSPAGPAGAPAVPEKHARVLRLIHAYRARGHRVAATDPLGASPSYFPELDPAHYGLGQDDLAREFLTGDLPGGTVQPLGRILARLRATYCR
ncbi:MAG TPA: hypothetical protein VHQ66_02355, partial [Myxococcota bacterium]|nr:hypothetical protein [Myxococcota bacterium]